MKSKTIFKMLGGWGCLLFFLFACSNPQEALLMTIPTAIIGTPIFQDTPIKNTNAPSTDIPSSILPSATSSPTSSPTNTPPPPTLEPTATETSTPRPTPTEIPLDTGWQDLGNGLEERTINLFDGQDRHVNSIYIIRLLPTNFRLDVEYDPENPQTITRWQEKTGALVVVNAGFFTHSYEATGRIIVDGVGSGVSYAGGTTGMVAIFPNGNIEIRELDRQPYNANEVLQAGFQAFPILVNAGGQQAYSTEQGQRARRTVIAKDKQGYLLLMIASRTHLTLTEMSHFLANSDLDLEVALNLDGGPSSGIWLSSGQGIRTFVRVPTVLAIYRMP